MAGDLPAALETYAQAIEQAPASPEVQLLGRMGISGLLRDQGDLPGALEILSPLTPRTPEERQLLAEQRATLLLESGRGEEAAASFGEAGAAADPESEARAAAAQGRAEALTAAGDLPGAAAAWAEVIDASADPVGKAWASLSLGDLRSAQGDRAGAEALFAAQYDHPTAEVALDARVRQARLHMQNSELDAALTLLAPLDAAPLGADWDASLIEARAMARLMGGDRAGAAAEWSALVARHPGEPEAQLPAWLGLARTFHAGGDGPLAASFLSRLRGATEDAGYLQRAADLEASFALQN
jgi:predicted negative regulator of RcsB-dependent stress response